MGVWCGLWAAELSKVRVGVVCLSNRYLTDITSATTTTIYTTGPVASINLLHSHTTASILSHRFPQTRARPQPPRPAAPTRPAPPSPPPLMSRGRRPSRKASAARTSGPVAPCRRGPLAVGAGAQPAGVKRRRRRRRRRRQYDGCTARCCLPQRRRLSSRSEADQLVTNDEGRSVIS